MAAQQTSMAEMLEKNMLRLALAFAFAPLSLAPAYAADIKTIDCVLKTVDPATRTNVIADVNDNFTHLDSQRYSKGSIDGIRAASVKCRTTYGWSESAAQASLLYALVAIAEPTLRQQASAAKLDYARLLSRFMALSEVERADAMQEAVLNRLAEEALAANEMNGANAKVAGGIFGFFAIRSKAVIDFVAN